MNFEKYDALVGAFVLAAAAVCVLTAAAVNRERLTAATYHVEIRLPKIAGIDKGVEVMYQGYKAGAVDRVTIAYEPEFRFIVRLAIKKELRLKSGTSVVVRNKGFGGAKYLELAAPAAGSGAGLVAEGAVLPALHESDLMAKANEVMGAFEKIALDFQKEGTSADVIRSLKHAHAALESLSGLLSENRAALKSAIEQTQGLASRGNDLLAKNDPALTQTLENLNRAAAHLPAIMANVEEFTAEIKRRPWRLLRKGDAGPAAKPEKD